MADKLYSQGPDGTYRITLDNGQSTPVRMTERQLQDLGYTAGDVPPPPPALTPPATEMDPREVAQMGSEAGHGPMMTGGVTQRSMPHDVPRDAPLPATDTGTPKEERTAQAPKAEPVDESGGPPPAGGYAPQYAPVRRIPGRDIRASFTRRPGVEVSDELKSAYESDTRAEDTEARAKAIADLRNEQQNERELNLMDQQKQLEVERARRAETDARIKQKRDLIDRRDKEIDSLTPKSANEILADRGILAELSAGLMIMIGAYQQGLTGRANNVGLDMVNQSIQADIDKQKEVYERAKERGEEARNDYAKALEIYGSPEAAEQDMLMRRFGIVEKMIQNRGEQIGTQQGLQAANEASQVYKMQRAEAMQGLKEKTEGAIVQENFVYQPERYVGGAPAMPKDAMERAVRLPNGEYVFARSSEAAKVAQKQLKVDSSLSEAAQRLIYLRSLPGAKTDPKLRGQIEGAAANLFMGLKEGANLGTLDKGAMDFRQEWTGDATALFDLGGADAKLNEISRASRNRVNDTIRYDLHPDPRSLAPYASARPPSRPNE